MHHLKHHFKKSSDAGDESSVTSSSLSADQAASEESSRAPRPHDPEKETGKPSRLRRKMDELTSDMSKLVNTVKVTVNPNHRHDEAWEQEVDAKMEAIRDGHRFRSFADERDGNVVKWHIDGHDYFWALSILIDQAKESIFIMDWWLTPELYLRRPPAAHPEWRLDRLLQRKAEQGVRIYVQVYKEVEASMTMSSVHTKHRLEDLHENIAVMRHPQHTTGDLVYYWSHHEKLCVVDNKMAAMGGLDACFGRWDTHEHPLADVHPTNFDLSLFPGQDYNNSRMMDFQEVDKFTSNALAIQDSPRMPWHDTSLTIIGPSVVDLSQHFIERWNFVKDFKYRHHHRYEWLSLPSPWGDVQAAEEAADEQRRIQRKIEHPHLAAWAEKGRHFAHPYHWPPSRQPRAMEPVPEGKCRVQVLRSSADWSHGILKEDSIQQAYIELIREANHTIYIENQFFITSTDDATPVRNKIGAALAQRIISAAKDGRAFRIIIVIPAVPAFAGDIQSQAGLKAIMEAQYRSVNRGGHSIFEVVRKAGYDPEPYISFWNLRSYDRINSPKGIIERMEKKSGVTFHQAQVALARVWIGSDDTTGDGQETVKLERPKDETGKLDQAGKKQTVNAGVPLPKTEQEARDVIKRFESGAEMSDEAVADNVGQHVHQIGHTLMEEPWHGTEEEELNCFVSELCYIHSKLMIVDDRRVICGSANLNDRSQVGDHDSEIAIVIEDGDMIETTMNGKKYMASRVAATWRRALMKEHLGLEDPQPAWDPQSDPRPAMIPAPHPHEETIGTERDKLVEDMLSPEFWKLWAETGMRNRSAFEKVFRPIPNNEIRSWSDYNAFLEPSVGVLSGHVANKELSLKEVKETLSTIRGHLVDQPLDFLIDVKEMTSGNIVSVNSYTLPIYM